MRINCQEYVPQSVEKLGFHGKALLCCVKVLGFRSAIATADAHPVPARRVSGVQQRCSTAPVRRTDVDCVLPRRGRAVLRRRITGRR